MLLDDRYPVLETLESRDGVTLYRVEGGWSSTLTSARPRTRTASTATGRRSGAWRSSASEAQVSAKPGRYYAFFPERPLSGRRPPRRSWPPWPPSASGRSTWPWGRTRWPTSPLGPSAWGPRGGAGGGFGPGWPRGFSSWAWASSSWPRGFTATSTPRVRGPRPGGQDRAGGLSSPPGHGAWPGGGGGERPPRPKEVVLEQDPHPAPASEPGGWCAWS